MKTSIFSASNFIKLTPTEEKNILIRFEQFVANFQVGTTTKQSNESWTSISPNKQTAIYQNK